MITSTVVINISDLNAVRHAMDAGRYVYCGRGSIYGNPIRITTTVTRADAIAAHKKGVLANPQFIQFVYDNLRGKTLGCHCKPKDCHCDLYADICNNPANYNIMEATSAPAVEAVFRNDGPALILQSFNRDNGHTREARITGWTGVLDDAGNEITFSPAAAIELFTAHPEIARQIMANAEACGVAAEVTPRGAGDVLYFKLIVGGV